MNTNEVYGASIEQLYGDLAVSVNKKRIIFKCKNKNCKHIWAKEYRKVFQRFAEWARYRDGRSYRIEEISSLVRFEDGKQVCRACDYDCPECGSHGEANIVVGSYSDHACDSRCMAATKSSCECSCGGKNHGASHM